MQLFKIFGSILIDDKEALNSLTKTEKASYKANQALNKISDTGKSIADVGSSLFKKMTLPILGIGAASFKIAADVEDSIGAVEQVFNKSSNAILDWADALPAYYGVSRAQALESASVMGSMLKNIGGLSEEVAATQTQALVELAGDLSAMYGGSTQDAMESITSALAGNNTAMKKYGTAILDADVKQKAFELGLYSGTGAMSAQAKQAGTMALIMDQTADSHGQAAREADQASGTMKTFTTTVKNLSAEIGEVLLPIITPMIQKISEWTQKFNGLDEGTKKNIVRLGLFLAAIGPVLIIVGKAIMIFASLSGIAAAMGITVGALVGPFAIAVGAIAAVIAIGVSLWKNWDTIKAKAGQLKDYVLTKFQQIGDGIMKPINWAKDGFGKAVDTIRGFLNFNWSLPKLKMPHFRATGSINPINWLKDGVPKISVDWYKDGGIMNNPTLFGIDGDRAMGGGEAGPEAILPLTSSVLGGIGKGIAGTMNNQGGTDINKLVFAFKNMLENIEFEIQDGGDSFKAIIDNRLIEVL